MGKVPKIDRVLPRCIMTDGGPADWWCADSGVAGRLVQVQNIQSSPNFTESLPTLSFIEM